MKLSPETKLAGVLAPVFALRSDAGHDLGVGDVRALREFVDWAAESGLRVVQVLPINETAGDNSPYNAISSVALEPVYADVDADALPDLPAGDAERARLLLGENVTEMQTGPVRYARVKALKTALLRAAFGRFIEGADEARRAEFVEFCRQEAGWLEDYALFRALMEAHGGNPCFTEWEEGRRTAADARRWLEELPEAAERRGMEREIEFRKYVQWIVFGQWTGLKAYAGERGVALFGDIPMGIGYYSADVFAEPEIFRLDWSSGAPPEPFFKDDLFTQKWGQNWGFPVYDWRRMREKDNFAWWRRRVQAVQAVFHLFRLDHVLGMYRIYAFPWRPEQNGEFVNLSWEEMLQRTGGRKPGFMECEDDNWEHRETNRRNGEEALRVILEAAGETRLVGEDLGLVPDYVRPSLTALGIAGFKIPIWETVRETGKLAAGGGYERLSVATYATHDHSPVRVFWNNWARQSRGEMIPYDQGARDGARWELRRLAEFAGLPACEDGNWPDYDDAALEGLLAGLLRCNSWVAIYMVTDLLGTEQRFNLPGAISELNWSERLGMSAAQLRADAHISARMNRVRSLVEASGRLTAE